MTTALIALDISRYQTQPDWAALKAAGILGVILKATEGTSYTDPTFQDRYAQAKAAGLGVGTYHFLKHGSADKQMRFYVDTVRPAPGERMVIDFEDKACTLDELRQAVKALAGLADIEVTVYGANGFLGALLGGRRDELLAQTALWVASYTSNPNPTMTDLAATWPAWSLWQYTDKASINGWGPVDGNRFNGTAVNFARWMGMLPAAEAPAPAPTPPPAAAAPIRLTMTVLIAGGAVTVEAVAVEDASPA